MDLMAIALQLMSAIIILVIKPFLLFKQACMFGLRTVFIITHTWWELLRATIRFHVNMFWSVIFWALAFITLPVRVLTAVQRESTLELHLNEMQRELENLLWERKQLEERLQTAITERRMMELMLEELEEEHDKAIVKIDILESELQDLNNENLRIKEIQGKGVWNFKGQDDMGDEQKISISEKYGIPCGIPSWRSDYGGSGTLQDILLHRDAWESESKTELTKFLKTESKASGPIQSFTPEIMSRNLHTNEAIDQQRQIAFSQSLFSAVLSLIVGMIIWEAEDPCMPLVAALFTVVGMSLKSVVEFFSTIKNKPASDAVALLSCNWFILGTLTYPTLPRVARMLSPLALRFVDGVLSWLGVSLY